MADDLLCYLEAAARAPRDREPAASLPFAVAPDVPFAVATLQRPENVDDERTLRTLIECLGIVARDMPVAFPAHPRTRAWLKHAGLPLTDGVSRIAPFSYLAFLSAWRRARCVLTDSGGLKEETTAIGIRSVRMRDSTERPIALSHGTKLMAGTHVKSFVDANWASMAADCGTERSLL